MALIKCPECNRKVSDSAISCPNCGFGIKPYVDKQKQEELKKTFIKNIPEPEEPEMKWGECFLGLPVGFSVMLFNPILGIIIGIVVFVIIAIGNYSDYKEKMAQYEVAKKDFEAYQNQEFSRRGREAQQRANTPKCPQCGSANIEKITSAGRAMSIEIWGAASSSIGKQYKCRNCRYKW